MSESPTPILDREAPLPPEVLRPRDRWWSVAHACLLAILVTILECGPSLTAHRTHLPYTLLGLLLLALVVHEAGHLIAGLVVGMRFRSIRVSLLRIDRSFRPSLELRFDALASGLTGMIPGAVDGAAPRVFTMVVAGPLVSIAAGAATLILPRIDPFWFHFGVVSIALGVLNLVPRDTSSYTSDGWRLLECWRRQGEVERGAALAMIADELERGKDVTDVDPHLMATAIAVRNASAETVSAYHLAFVRAWKEQDSELAARHLETCLQRASAVDLEMREQLKHDAALFQAVTRRRPDRADLWRMEMSKRGRPHLRSNAEVVVLIARGDVDGARAKLDELERGQSDLSKSERVDVADWIETWNTVLADRERPHEESA